MMKKFEPHYRLVRYGAATKIEKASRQQRMYIHLVSRRGSLALGGVFLMCTCKQASNARTGRRRCGEQRKERQRRRTRRNRPWRLFTVCPLGQQKQRGACLCVSTLCSCMLWRIRNSVRLELREGNKNSRSCKIRERFNLLHESY